MYDLLPGFLVPTMLPSATMFDVQCNLLPVSLPPTGAGSPESE